MSKAKIEKLLGLAFGTANKDEAAVAFSRAVAYANREGIDLRTVKIPGAPEPEPSSGEFHRAYRGASGQYQNPFAFNEGRDTLELMRLRLSLTQEQQDHAITRQRYTAEKEAHGKTLTELERTRIILADREAKIQGVRDDVNELNKMCHEAIKEKNTEIQHKDWEIAALKRQIELLKAE